MIPRLALALLLAVLPLPLGSALANASLTTKETGDASMGASLPFVLEAGRVTVQGASTVDGRTALPSTVTSAPSAARASLAARSARAAPITPGERLLLYGRLMLEGG